VSLPIGPKPTPRRFHEARWDEPIVLELDTPGERGFLPSTAEPELLAAVADRLEAVPGSLRRTTPVGGDCDGCYPASSRRDND